MKNKQISVAINKKSIFHYISANTGDNRINKVSIPMFSRAKITIKPFEK